MLLLLFGLLNALSSDVHKDIKILTKDRKYELTLNNPRLSGEYLVFAKTTEFNRQDNIFRYEPALGGILTMMGHSLSWNNELMADSQHIRPTFNPSVTDDWRISGVGSTTRIKNSKNMCLKFGKRLPNTASEMYDALAVPCTLSDSDQELVIVEIPRNEIDVCNLFAAPNSCRNDGRYVETMTDVKNRPNLT
ncbi:hypothetical protein NBO_32g0012 [Nosema bombycis CQ1]|uniref:Uncharacterized protein n=1 Tax=Nosema bombycis (strain CQ1 / CVCC 102059) TaxID=578461 RepID=R0KVJ2_NOSB1|nr:hypothetical protein NBO_32g0012 [Nosema bombycis CQ1]|eukprot:EOB14237.1 hypothetical protein NBO_32g0012 [Nosema bombycis CQ1]